MQTTIMGELSLDGSVTCGLRGYEVSCAASLLACMPTSGLLSCLQLQLGLWGGRGRAMVVTASLLSSGSPQSYPGGVLWVSGWVISGPLEHMSPAFLDSVWLKLS